MIDAINHAINVNLCIRTRKRIEESQKKMQTQQTIPENEGKMLKEKTLSMINSRKKIDEFEQKMEKLLEIINKIRVESYAGEVK